MKTLYYSYSILDNAVIKSTQNLKKMENNEQDYIAITEVLEKYYFKGIYEGDVNKLKQVLYPGTLLFGDVKWEPYAKTLDQYLYGVQQRQSPKDSGKLFKGTIVSIDIVNSIAVARVQVKMYDFDYTDLLSFHKLDNRWFIVNKMFTDVAD